MTSEMGIIRTVSIVNVAPLVLVERSGFKVSGEKEATCSPKCYLAAKILDLTTHANMDT
jgi:hypothetical protein